MNNLGPYGINLSIATNRLRNAKTPADRQFAHQLTKNLAASEVVSQVDSIRDSVLSLDGSKHDGNGAEGSVKLDAEVSMGRISKAFRGFGDPLKFVASSVGSQEKTQAVKGQADANSLDVFVQTDGAQGKTFSYSEAEDGSRTYSAGNQQVSMNANGTLTTIL